MTSKKIIVRQWWKKWYLRPIEKVLVLLIGDKTINPIITTKSRELEDG